MASFYPIPNLLNAEQVAELRTALGDAKAKWTDGKQTAGQDAHKKRNLELDPLGSLRRRLSDKLIAHVDGGKTPESLMFQYYTRAKTVGPFLFSKTSDGGGYGDHIDNNFIDLDAKGISRIRADLSMTIFLSDPSSYDGGELALNTDMAFCPQFKMPAGGAVLYTTDVVHRVNPVTRGERLAAITWIESEISDIETREINADLLECLNVLAMARPNAVPPEQARFVFDKLEKARCRIEKRGLG